MSSDDLDQREPPDEQERERRREERRREREAQRERRRRDRERRRGRKERVLHTRISDRLAEDIRNVAEELRVPVSNLVRNVLEDAFSMAEVVGSNVGELVEEVVEEADRAADRLARRARRYAHEYREFERWREGEQRPERQPGRRWEDEEPEDRAEHSTPAPEFPDVLGWQPLVLNGAQRCAGCARALERGDRAFLGVAAGGGGTVWLCPACAP